MDPPQYRRRKPVSEEKRKRDLFLLYGAAFRDLPHLDELGPNSETCSLPGDHVPRISSDSTLTALAQLATFRLSAGRAMISLLDDERQYILAEATPNMSLRSESPGNAPSTLWLGSVSIPRTWGMCEKVLNIDLRALQTDEYPAIVIRDLKESVEHANRSYIKESSVRFYASAPLLSPSGAIVGSICILDDLPRPNGLSKEHRKSLQDIAESVMDYLHSYTVKDQYRRGEQFTRGLISFSEGASNLLPFENVSQRDPEAPVSMNVDLSIQDSLSPGEEAIDPLKTPQQISTTKSPTTVRIRGNRQRSMKTLQETILPIDSRSMFSRAANVMMASSNLNGVVILDASVAANQHHQRQNSQGSQDRSTGTGTGTGTGTEDAGDSYQSRTSSSDEGTTQRAGRVGKGAKVCQVLGSATSKIDPFVDAGVDSLHGSLLETDLTHMLHDYPHGKVITFDMDGVALSSTDEGASSGVSEVSSYESPKRKATGNRTSRITKAMIEMLPGARSVAFVPFWDYERSRWFAGCLCWSTSPNRLLSASVDLAYFKVFSHSIMRELSRLDALALNQAKTTFVASISHELRSPLHGILGTLEFIKDTPLDSFQVSMLNSLNACGQTLLDTINHVMDYAKIREETRNVSSRRLKSTHTVRLSSKPLKSRRSRAGAFDLGIATEEVVEAVFSGSSYVPVSGAVMARASSSSESESESVTTPKRKTCFIVLDLAHEENWVYNFPIGSWRRIVMNIFGNAVKYTEAGHIHVSLRISDGSRATEAPTTVVLTITDSGAGMSPQFLANKAFQPFSQENSFASGTGLGLSIVRQIIETNGGKIEVSSEPSVGTRFTVKLALKKPESIQTVPPQRAQMLSFSPRLAGRNICILRRQIARGPGSASTPQLDEGLIRFTNALATTLEKHLKMHVIQTANWEGHNSDIVIVPELSFEYLAAIRRARVEGRRAPVTIFVAMDALEAATLRSDARVQKKESVVEIITQPCGPYKLAHILNRCLDRFELPEENLSYLSSGSTRSESPSFGVSNNEKLSHPPGLLNQLDDPQVSTTVAPHIETSGTPSARDTIAIPNRPAPSATQILIVDDNAINRSLLVAFMKKHKYSYLVAENGLEALEAYQQDPPRFKIVLMDLSMPVMDGMTSTRAIREYEDIHNIARCRIIALTGLASASARLEALSSGVDQFITKPLNFKLLRSLLEKENEKTRHVIEARDIKESREEEKVEEKISLERQKDEDNIPQQEAEMSERQQDSAKIESQREADKTEHYEVIRNPEARQNLGQVELSSQTTKTELQEEVEKREPQHSVDVSQEH